MSKKKGFLGALVIGAVALVSLLGLFVVSPSCAGAAPDAGLEDAVPVAPPPVIDPRAEALEATVQAAVAATVTAATAFTVADIEATVEAVLATRESESTMEPDRRSRVFGTVAAATVTSEPSATPILKPMPPATAKLGPDVLPFGPAPVFEDDWSGVYGPLGYCAVPEGGFGIPCIDGWLRVVDDYSVSDVDPEGAVWLSVGWVDASLEINAETRLADLPEEATGWPLYEFFGRSDVMSLSGVAGVRLDYGRQAVVELCAERVSEAWYEAGGLMYLVSYGYCRDDWEELGGYQDTVVLGVTFGGFR